MGKSIIFEKKTIPYAVAVVQWLLYQDLWLYKALRWMGAFGGWSLKRELGYGNLRLAQGITYYTCSFWKPKRSVIYIYTASILPRPYMHLLSEPMTRELREVIKCRKEILNKSMVKVAISKQGKKTV